MGLEFKNVYFLTLRTTTDKYSRPINFNGSVDYYILITIKYNLKIFYDFILFVGRIVGENR